uniref:Uncharacterized protein n=1 Tax=Arundo donax TaxID=35708 RepID=A0A0A8YRB6_ARUDO
MCLLCHLSESAARVYDLRLAIIGCQIKMR